jgi:2'-5' RNA ligase
MRLFLAVNLSPEVRHALSRAQEQLKATGADVRWANADGLHITLKFLGEVADTRVPDIARIGGQVAGETKPFEIRVEGLGAFPSPRSPRVIWAGVVEGAKELTSIAERIEALLEPVGFPKEKRPFSAHVTLGRARTPGGKDKLLPLLESRQNFGLSPATCISLMSSELRPGGALYTIVEEFKLAAE